MHFIFLGKAVPSASLSAASSTSHSMEPALSLNCGGEVCRRVGFYPDGTYKTMGLISREAA